MRVAHGHEQRRTPKAMQVKDAAAVGYEVQGERVTQHVKPLSAGRFEANLLHGFIEGITVQPYRFVSPNKCVKC